MTGTGLLFYSNDIENESEIDLLETTIPHIIKYMGSKKPIIEFVAKSINEVHTNENAWVTDLFAGSCSISAYLRRKYNFISNDIQEYSCVLAHTYFSNLSTYNYQEVKNQIDKVILPQINWYKKKFKSFLYDYSKIDTIVGYQKVETAQRDLLKKGKFDNSYHLFTKYYSGTYWSFEQCIWIDSLRKAADEFKGTPLYYVILSSIMFAMSYTTQSTGHFAQYRDGNSDEAVENIIFYRQKDFYELFLKKLSELINCLDNSLKTLKTSSLNFEECLKLIPNGGTVYCDPPYASVHYSRFYHVLETLVKYDYPEIDFKGRYRDDRHQSPFSQKSKALEAFATMFDGIISKSAQMVLSYSGSGVVGIEEIITLANKRFNQNEYMVSVRTLGHKHSTMGRFEDHERDVTEYLIIAKTK